jgi:hypothetical protein
MGPAQERGEGGGPARFKICILVPRGVNNYSSGTAQAVLDHAPAGARLVFSCGWHITRDGQDVYSWKVKMLVNVVGRLAKLARLVDLDDQVEACRRIFASDTRWTVVRSRGTGDRRAPDTLGARSRRIALTLKAQSGPGVRPCARVKGPGRTVGNDRPSEEPVAFDPLLV